MFKGCSLLNYINLSKLNTKSAKNMSGMFYGYTSLTTINVSSFITSKVKDMSWMFYNCRSLILLDASNFNVESSVNKSFMFFNCSSLQYLDISGFYINIFMNFGMDVSFSNLFNGLAFNCIIYIGNCYHFFTVLLSQYCYCSIYIHTYDENNEKINEKCY